jgi:hypothetical protein
MGLAMKGGGHALRKIMSRGRYFCRRAFGTSSHKHTCFGMHWQTQLSPAFHCLPPLSPHLFPNSLEVSHFPLKLHSKTLVHS